MTERRRLPDRRLCETFMMRWGQVNTEFSITIGYFPTPVFGRRGPPGEVFISGAKIGSNMDALTKENAVMISLALQYGCPLTVMQGAIPRELDGSPSTIGGQVIDLLVRSENE